MCDRCFDLKGSSKFDVIFLGPNLKSAVTNIQILICYSTLIQTKVSITQLPRSKWIHVPPSFNHPHLVRFHIVDTSLSHRGPLPTRRFTGKCVRFILKSTDQETGAWCRYRWYWEKCHRKRWLERIVNIRPTSAYIARRRVRTKKASRSGPRQNWCTSLYPTKKRLAEKRHFRPGLFQSQVGMCINTIIFFPIGGYLVTKFSRSHPYIHLCDIIAARTNAVVFYKTELLKNSSEQVSCNLQTCQWYWHMPIAQTYHSWLMYEKPRIVAKVVKKTSNNHVHGIRGELFSPSQVSLTWMSMPCWYWCWCLHCYAVTCIITTACFGCLVVSVERARKEGVAKTNHLAVQQWA